MTDAQMDSTVLGELALALDPPDQWFATGGIVFTDDGKPEPWDRPETIIAKFYGPEERKLTNSQFLVACSTQVAALVGLLERSRAETRQARSDAARLAEAIEKEVNSDQLKISTAERLTDAIKAWEASLEEAGIRVYQGPGFKAAGVQAEAKE